MKLETKPREAKPVNESMEKQPCGTDDVAESKLRRRQLAAALSPLISVYVSYVASTFNSLHTYRVISQNFSDRILADVVLIGSLALCLSNCVSGIAMTKLGRRKTLMLVFPVAAVGCSLTGYADSYAGLVLARVVCCCSVGLSTPLVPIYISEISDNVYRSSLLRLVYVNVISGVVVATSLYAMFGTENTYVFVVISLLFWPTCLASSESPAWLLQKGRREEAVNGWVHLRGRKPWDQFLDLERESECQRLHNESQPTLFRRMEYTILSKQFGLGLAVSCAFYYTYIFSRFSEVISYASVNMMQLAFDSQIAKLIIALIYVNTILLFCYLMPRYNRRTLTMFSGFGTAFALVLINVFGYLNMQLLIVASCLLHLVFMMLGLVPLSYVISCELLPQRAKVLGSVLGYSFWEICLMTDVKDMTELDGISPKITLFNTIFMVMGIAFLYWKLPETKDKTLTEIESIFENDKKLQVFAISKA